MHVKYLTEGYIIPAVMDYAKGFIFSFIPPEKDVLGGNYIAFITNVIENLPSGIIGDFSYYVKEDDVSITVYCAPNILSQQECLKLGAIFVADALEDLIEYLCAKTH
jgi:hypothetical protein